jgi:predicted house-cleaning noncanonical NTP pyrophosphatase (MazG superfamily)
VYAKSREFYDALKLLLACKLAEFMTDEDVEEVPDEIDMLDNSDDEDEDDDEDLYKVDEFKTDALALEALQQARDSARGREHVFFKYF